MSYSSRRITWNWIILFAILALAAWLLGGCANINLGGTQNVINVSRHQTGGTSSVAGELTAGQTNANSASATIPASLIP